MIDETTLIILKEKDISIFILCRELEKNEENEEKMITTEL
jgi:hypothetical protein